MSLLWSILKLTILLIKLHRDLKLIYKIPIRNLQVTIITNLNLYLQHHLWIPLLNGIPQIELLIRTKSEFKKCDQTLNRNIRSIIFRIIEYWISKDWMHKLHRFLTMSKANFFQIQKIILEVFLQDNHSIIQILEKINFQ